MACTIAPAIAVKCMMAVSFVLAVLASTGVMGGLVPPELSMMETHERWMAEHGHVYKDAAEKEHRFKIFSANVQYIESFNAEGKHKYKLGTNQFTDLTDEEFRAKYIGRSSRPTTPSTAIVTNATSPVTNANLELPPTWDWRDADAVTPVKNQLFCNCCREFPVIAAIESIVKIKTGDLISLSEQELMDCSSKDECHGGDDALAYEYVIEKGVASEKDYPYSGLYVADCASSNHPRVANITKYNAVQQFNETALLEAVANQPVSAEIEASGATFRHYSSGIFTGECGSEPNRGVAIVGYGTADDGTKYWIIKNSWSAKWGEGGYMRLLRDVSKPEGLCGITKTVLYPIIEFDS